MIRYAVKVLTTDGIIKYESIGKGLVDDPQDAHLYTRVDLAEKKSSYYNRPAAKPWYQSAQVVEAIVTGLY